MKGSTGAEVATREGVDAVKTTVYFFFFRFL